MIINPLFSYPREYNPVLAIGSPRTGIPKRVPEPSNSLKNPTIIRITPYPRAFPIPSRKDFHGPFPRAKASKRPMMIQLVMISPTKTARVLLNSYAKAFST
jgi:hypothetical protein